ncbi:MAG: DUF3616 domain-containing protein [Verrucomicrobiaceae bacterium]|nr:DUF3616 domain-containing protein [Verrucomicrobiaceae bacterium]
MPLTLSVIVLTHFGLLDGSAAVAIDDKSFVVATDELNTLFVSRFASGGPQPVFDLDRDLHDFPSAKKKKGGFKEADLEGAAKVGDNLIYWIGSHSRDGDGDDCPQRQVFFATKLSEESDCRKALVKEGKVYTNLLADMIGDPKLKKFKLEEAATKKPKNPNALNIESLCTAADGKTLLIGFRSPITNGKALLLPLTNSAAITSEGSHEKAVFDDPVELDLHGLGVRDMVWHPKLNAYLIIGGHYDEHLNDPDAAKPKLFQWSGDKDKKPKETAVKLDELNPEALVLFPDDRVLILSDDGGLEVTPKIKQKDELKNKTKRQDEVFFRSVWLDVTQ